MTHTMNIYQRIHAVMQEVDYVFKNLRVTLKPGVSYPCVSHDAVVAKVRPAMIKHGIVALSDVVASGVTGNRTEATVAVTFVNVDNPEDRFTVHGFGHGIDSQDKGPGKAVSYATKYVWLKTFVLETGDDPERDNVDFSAKDLAQEAKEKEAKEKAAKDAEERKVIYAKITEARDKVGMEKAALTEWIKDTYGKERGEMSTDELKTVPAKILSTFWNGEEGTQAPAQASEAEKPPTVFSASAAEKTVVKAFAKRVKDYVKLMGMQNADVTDMLKATRAVDKFEQLKREVAAVVVGQTESKWRTFDAMLVTMRQIKGAGSSDADIVDATCELLAERASAKHQRKPLRATPDDWELWHEEMKGGLK